jgi:hypothetical protein
MVFCLGKLTNFQNKVERIPETVESNRSGCGGSPVASY